jgi:hypothetical protein
MLSLVAGSLILLAEGWAADSAAPREECALREALLKGARPAIRELLASVETKAELQVLFSSLPDESPVRAASIYDPARGEARIDLRKDWEDVDVAHELIHLQMDLVDRFKVLAWRRNVSPTPATDAAVGRVQTYIKDELVHARLRDLGLKLDGEILRPPLFDDVYANVATYLEEGRPRPADGMSHLDALGYGTLCRAAFLVQAELILKNYRPTLPKTRVRQTERFVHAFREHRPEETARADIVLELFRKFDVSTHAGQAELLRQWAALEKLDNLVGLSAYQPTVPGKFILPFPAD